MPVLQLSERMRLHLDKLPQYLRDIAMTYMMSPHRRTAAITALPTLAVGHTDDLKLEWRLQTDDMDGGALWNEYRYWVSRMTKEDGARMDREIILEHRYETGWRKAWGWRQFSHGPA